MNLQEILELGKLGYTKEEIEALRQETTQEEPTHETSPVDDAQDVRDVNVEKQNVEKQDALDQNIFNDFTATVDSINNKLKELEKAIQQNNILNSSLQMPKTETAEEILAKIITPNGGIKE